MSITVAALAWASAEGAGFLGPSPRQQGVLVAAVVFASFPALCPDRAFSKSEQAPGHGACGAFLLDAEVVVIARVQAAQPSAAEQKGANSTHPSRETPRSACAERHAKRRPVGRALGQSLHKGNSRFSRETVAEATLNRGLFVLLH